MTIKPGQVVDFFLVDGKKVVLRYPKISDVKKLQKFINQGIEESLKAGGRLGRVKKMSLKEEKEWLKSVIKKNKMGSSINIVAECNDKIIGSAEIRKDDHEACYHVGIYGIAVLEKYTNKGLGTKLTQIIIKLAKKNLKIEIVKLSVFSENKRAIGLYKKVGFEYIGKIKNGRKVSGKYADDVIMVKHLI